MLWVPFYQYLVVKRMLVLGSIKTGEQRKKFTITNLTLRLKPEPRLVSALAVDYLRPVGRFIFSVLSTEIADKRHLLQFLP